MKSRIAHFGFRIAILCILVAALPARAMTQEEAINAIKEQVSGGGGDNIPVWPALAAVGLGMIVLILKWRRTEKRAVQPLNHRGKLIREMRKATEMKRREMWKLKGQAKAVGRASGTKIENPLLMELCPSLRRPNEIKIKPPAPKPNPAG